MSIAKSSVALDQAFNRPTFVLAHLVKRDLHANYGVLFVPPIVELDACHSYFGRDA